MSRHLTLHQKLCQLFDPFVGSVISYGFEVWGLCKSKELERLHLKFLKHVLGVKLSTSNAGVYGELCRYPLYISRCMRIIRYNNCTNNGSHCIKVLIAT